MISCVVSLMSICIVLCIIVSMMSMRIANEAAMRMENAMSASGIAGLSVDLEKYASSFLNGDALVVVSDAETSYELYKKTFNINISDTEGFINNINIKNTLCTIILMQKIRQIYIILIKMAVLKKKQNMEMYLHRMA